MPRQPSISALETAIAWLEINEGSDGEAEDCASVADWLREKAKATAAREAENAAIRHIANEQGVKPAQIRKRLAASRKAKRC